MFSIFHRKDANWAKRVLYLKREFAFYYIFSFTDQNDNYHIVTVTFIVFKKCHM